MISFAFIVIFVFCLAIAGASVLIGHQFISTYNSDFHKNYFYYLVSFYAFALYGIWGHILIRTLLGGLNTRIEVIEAVSNFSSILGLPFLFISWIMLVKMAYSLFGKNTGNSWGIYYVLLFTLMLFGVWIGYDRLSENGVIEGESVRYIQIAYLSIFGLINYIVFITLIKKFNRNSSNPVQYKILTFSILLVFGFIIQIVSSAFAFLGPWQLGIVILLFFASNFIPLLYLKIQSDFIFEPVKAESSSEAVIEGISKRYKITKRECEIVTQICLGKTNQQIADELFISLQTVKDHTHRIYSKIGINSRMQLVQLVNK